MANSSCAFLRPKNRKAGLDRPLKVGGGIQPRLVTVLTPATTFTVGQDFIQNRRAVNSGPASFTFFRISYSPLVGRQFDGEVNKWRAIRDNLRNFFLSPPTEMLGSFFQQLREGVESTDAEKCHL